MSADFLERWKNPLVLIGLHVPFQSAALSPAEFTAFLRSLCVPGKQLPRSTVFGAVSAVGQQAELASDKPLVLFSGHILNRSELRLRLGLGQCSDADLYARGYSQWGDDVDLQVVGEFATVIVLHDQASARMSASPFTCPPLHYAHDGSQFVVASRAQALFDSGRIARRLDEQKVADSLFLNYSDPTQGWFLGVSRLAAGTRAYVTPDGVRLERYRDVQDVSAIHYSRDEDYVEAAEALFSEGTRLMLGGFEKPAVSLSGGLDSQAVAAYAMHLRPTDNVRSYTSVPETGWDGRTAPHRFGDERHHVDALAKMYPQLQTIWIDAAGKSFDHRQRDMFEFALQSPRNAMNLHWIHDLRERARQDGCDVMLNGSLGNATFSYSGDQALSGFLSKGQIGKLFKELWTGGSIAALPRRFIGQAVMPLLPRSLWELVNRVRRSPADPFTTWCPMNRDYAADLRVEERAEAVGFDPMFRPPADSRSFRGKLLMMAGGEGADIRLAMDCIHGLPSRDPTSYRPLVEFCLGIPDDQYLRNGVRRWLAKRMLAGKLPDVVRFEKRRGLQAADWHLRLSRQRVALIDEIDWLREDPSIERRLNLASLRQTLVDFPEATPNDPAIAARLQLAVTRGLTSARFIRYLEGRNS